MFRSVDVNIIQKPSGIQLNIYTIKNQSFIYYIISDLLEAIPSGSHHKLETIVGDGLWMKRMNTIFEETDRGFKMLKALKRDTSELKNLGYVKNLYHQKNELEIIVI